METSIAKGFMYEPLEDDLSCKNPDVQGAWSIRVIELQPGDADAPVICSLHHIPLGKANGHYEALSYVWGAPEKTHPIRVNHEELMVTNNLASALRRLRYSKSPRRLWADAICIDQNNIEERNIQVQRMWAIYALASRVVIDLGEETWDSRAGMEMIWRLADLGDDPKNVLGFFENNLHQSFSMSCKGLRNIFDRPWWSRVWIVQEVAVARDAIVICGAGELPWAKIEKVVDILTDLSFHPEKYVKGYGGDVRLLYLPSLHLAPPWSICTARRRLLEDEEDHSLASMMICFRSANTADPRDHLYGLLKLSPEAQQIVPDYTKSAVEVYKDIVRLSIVGDVGLAVFSALEYGNSRLDLPSWCPDWTASSPANFPFYMPRFCCTRDKQVIARFEDKSLALRGIRLDRVVATSIPTSTRMALPFDELYRAADRLWTDSISHLEFTRKTADFIGKATELFSRQRYFERLHELSDLQDRKIAQIYGTWLMRRTLELASNPYNYTLKVQHLSRSSALAMINEKEDMQIVNIAHGRTIFLTEEGELGLAPRRAQAGDIIVALYGGRTPFCLRPIPGIEEGRYMILGDCYMEKWMCGAAIDLLEEQVLHEEEFSLL